MAKRTIEVLTSDLSGDEIKDGRTVTFAFDGVQYEIDLTDKEIAGFEKSIAMYIEHGQRVGGRRGSGGKAKTDKTQLAAMRQWLRDNGHDVSDRGRISQELQDIYNASH